MLVPNQATHKLNAEKWINYYYEPEIAAKLAAWVNYICPVQGAQQEMEKIDKSAGGQPADLPANDGPEERLRLHGARPRNRQTQYERDWSNVTGG